MTSRSAVAVLVCAGAVAVETCRAELVGRAEFVCCADLGANDPVKIAAAMHAVRKSPFTTPY